MLAGRTAFGGKPRVRAEEEQEVLYYHPRGEQMRAEALPASAASRPPTGAEYPGLPAERSEAA